MALHQRRSAAAWAFVHFSSRIRRSRWAPRASARSSAPRDWATACSSAPKWPGRTSARWRRCIGTSAPACGKTDPGTVGASRCLMVGTSKEDAADRARAYLDKTFNMYATWRMQEDGMVPLQLDSSIDLDGWTIHGSPGGLCRDARACPRRVRAGRRRVHDLQLAARRPRRASSTCSGSPSEIVRAAQGRPASRSRASITASMILT